MRESLELTRALALLKHKGYKIGNAREIQGGKIAYRVNGILRLSAWIIREAGSGPDPKSVPLRPPRDKGVDSH